MNGKQPVEKPPIEFYKAIRNGNLKQVQKFIQAGVDLEQRGYQRCTPLELAVVFGHLEIVRSLLKAGASIFNDATSLLESTKQEGKTDILLALISAGIDVNQQLKEDEERVLMYVAGKGNIRAVKALVEAGADVNAVSRIGDFALLNAAWGGHQEVFDYLAPLTSPKLRQEAEEILLAGLIRRQRLEDKFTEDFISAAEMGDIQGVLKAIQDGVNINAIGADENTALYIAAYRVHVPVVHALIEAGANLDRVREYDGETPLMAAAGRIALSMSQISVGEIARLEVIRRLIEAGADVNARNNDGWTALMKAATVGNIEVVKLLLKAGADINAKNIRGDKALSCAKKAGHQKIIQLLRGAGAKED